MQQLEQTRPDTHRLSHDDTFRHPLNSIPFSVERSFEKVICGLFEGCKHENAVLHLRDTETGDAENFALFLVNVSERNKPPGA